jgi:hypothetical protein
MRKSIYLVLIVPVLIVLLVGCGGTKKETGKPATTQKPSTTTGPGTYNASFGGVEVSLSIPAGEDSTAQSITGFSTKLGGSQPASPVTIGSFTVKNGSSTSTRCELFTFSLTFADGKQVDGQRAAEYVSALQDKIPATDESGLYNEGVNLYNQLIEPTDIVPGASRNSYCVFKVGDLAGLSKVFVSQYSGGTKEMKQQ